MVLMIQAMVARQPPRPRPNEGDSHEDHQRDRKLHVPQHAPAGTGDRKGCDTTPMQPPCLGIQARGTGGIYGQINVVVLAGTISADPVQRRMRRVTRWE